MVILLVNAGIFILGLAVLIYGADSLVKGSSSLAKKAGLSNIFIGLTIVAFGTSMPELVVNVLASFKGNNDLAIGNIIGSNISNILLILGISAIIYPLVVKRGTITKEIPFALLAVVVVFILGNDFLFDGLQRSLMSRADGLILLCFFAIFIYYTIGISKAAPSSEDEPVKTYAYPVTISLIIGGLLGLVIGGNFLVDSSVAIARFFHVSEALIGLTIVAVGTSLPELATSAIAATRKHSDIAIGNIVGSNIFNIFWILGVSATINPLSFSPKLNIDVFINTLITLLLLIYMFVGKKNILQRWQGATMVGLYACYVIYLIIRG